MKALTAKGGEARFVGGVVRDALLKRPVRDIDIATPLLARRSDAAAQMPPSSRRFRPASTTAR